MLYILSKAAKLLITDLDDLRVMPTIFLENDSAPCLLHFHGCKVET